MKLSILSILIVFAFGATGFAQTDVQGVIVGNDPTATLTTGIGQVIKRVGTPVIQSPASTLFAPQPQPAVTPTTAGKQRVLSDMTTAPEIGKAKWISIPESKLPRIQTIPYR